MEKHKTNFFPEQIRSKLFLFGENQKQLFFSSKIPPRRIKWQLLKLISITFAGNCQKAE